MAKCEVIAIVNQKGGVGKTTTCGNLGIGLVRNGKKVLLIDCDPQASLTISLGHSQPDRLPITLTDLLNKVLEEEPIKLQEGILHHDEGVAFVPSSIELSGLEVSLVNVMNREKILKEYVDSLKPQYDFILIDCMPSLGMLTINALTAANSVLIPVPLNEKAKSSEAKSQQCKRNGRKGKVIVIKDGVHRGQCVLNLIHLPNIQPEKGKANRREERSVQEKLPPTSSSAECQPLKNQRSLGTCHFPNCKPDSFLIPDEGRVGIGFFPQ